MKLDKRLYSDSDNLGAFLDSLNYSHVFGHIAPIEIAESLTSAGLPSGAPISILDIGAGRGDVTIPAFEALGKLYTVSVTLLEPDPNNLSAFKMRYDAMPRSFTVKEAIESDLQAFRPTRTFDLVFASHSLYEPIEEAPDLHEAATETVRKITSLARTPHGLVSIILASPDSFAYACKALAYQILGIDQERYAHSKHIVNALGRLHIEYKCIEADTYADMRTFHSRHSIDRQTTLKWLAYFLRVNLANMSTEMQEQVSRIFEHASIPWKSLPKCCQLRFTDHPATCGIDELATFVLFHKEEMILFEA